MGSNSPKELKLSLSDLKPAPDFISLLSISPSSSSKLKRYIDGLLDERRKIEAFKHEFPLSIVLLNQVIDRLKGDEEEKAKEGKCCNYDGNRGVESGLDEDDKKNWMSSAQLWCSSFSPSPSTFLQGQNNEENEGPRSDQVHGSGKYNDTRGAFPSFQKNVDAANLTLTTNSQQRLRRTAVVIGGRTVATRPVVLSSQVKLASKVTNRSPNPTPPPPYLAARKTRRNWSPELHRRFVDCLEKLGGPQVATPKQIRDLMQVEGLTNDEVKSHLQKYRLHARKVPSSSPTSSNEISMGQVLQLDITSKAGTSFSDSPEGPLQLTMRSANCNSSAASGESSMEEDQRSDGRR